MDFELTTGTVNALLEELELVFVQCIIRKSEVVVHYGNRTGGVDENFLTFLLLPLTTLSFSNHIIWPLKYFRYPRMNSCRKQIYLEYYFCKRRKAYVKYLEVVHRETYETNDQEFTLKAGYRAISKPVN
ncbi:hypothetical protein GQX74_001009 [Glossina fuscipes]|nr:hypothetical protein GQX74_001009 [Glossina fuscipes]